MGFIEGFNEETYIVSWEQRFYSPVLQGNYNNKQCLKNFLQLNGFFFQTNASTIGSRVRYEWILLHSSSIRL